MKPAFNVILIAALCCQLQAGDNARNTAPSYTASSIVNSANYAPGALAPYTLATIFGTDLSFSKADWSSTSMSGELPVELGGVSVLIGGLAAPLIYVSATQINLVIPGSMRTGDAKLRVMRQGVAGPEVVLAITDSSPAFFCLTPGSIVATRADGSVITEGEPARPGQIVVLYATGLGLTDRQVTSRSLPTSPSSIIRLADFRLFLDGVPVDRSRIYYVGVTPGFAGLYQINVALPESTGTDPEVRIAIGDQISNPGLKLAVR